ncbi:L-histidine N(alpha)-methyltransferase [Pseudonocardia sp. TRM90224]|uniref:L-histidine N(alpha)-methyltransferase n=1 Tax=Pseudonocardia sp. TRM90224 TaxID=2812678 RepID=UPI001E30C643|nr:L-histidine N(alpha)-methyltransferase [Pseudonocardia sp. TRM90224]
MTVVGPLTEMSGLDDAAVVRACLTEAIPRLPPWLGYDEVGSRLFEAITELPTYYLTRSETGLLHRHAGEIADLVEGERIAELGSGSAKKTRLLLAECQRRGPTTYVPIDVSQEMLADSAEALRTSVPGLQVTALWGRYEAGLHWLRHNSGPTVVTFLGCNLGNTTPDERAALLDDIAATLRPGDGFMVSVDLDKSPAQMETCYNDPPGYSAFAQFRLNHLVQLNERFGSDFDVGKFYPRARYDSPTRTVEGHLYASEDQEVSVPALDLTVSVRRGGSVNVGFSAKFDRATLVTDLAGRGLRLRAEWLDPQWEYGIFLFRKR